VFTISPMKGSIPSNSSLSLKVTPSLLVLLFYLIWKFYVFGA
jgi:hypothetical protein